MTKFYAHEQSGDIQSESDWRDGHDHMDIESWYGCEADDADTDNWIEAGHLIEIDMDSIIEKIQENDGPLVFDDACGNGVALINNQSFGSWNDVVNEFDIEVAEFET